MPPLISIVINNFNYDKYIGYAIESAINQTYSFVEIIVIDDGSTDNSIELIKGFNLENSFFKKNGGQVSAINFGYGKSSGDIVIFLDSDDYLNVNACQMIADEYDENIIAYQFYLSVIDSHNVKQGKTLPKSFINGIDFQKFVLDYGYIPSAPMSGVAYSKRYLDTIFPFDENKWRTAIDGYLIYVAAVYNKIKVIDKELGYYRIHSDSESEHGFVSLKKTRQMLQVGVMYAEGIHHVENKVLSKPTTTINSLLGPYHWKNRIDSFLLDYKNHIFTNDSKFFLTYNCIVRFLYSPQLSFMKKIKNICLYSFVLILPKPIAAKLVGIFNKYPDL
ncbi:glycosyltransferase [Shewanella frigidimarina]|uniref:glycosyltransferase family 2 protein n=1 Tax=Shewanella frigidimarina TaxID=56812 RepID=UPI003179B68D